MNLKVFLPLMLVCFLASDSVAVAQLNPFQAAEEAFRARNFAKAESLYSEAIDANLRTDEALYGRASARYWQKDFSGAKRDTLRLRTSKQYGSKTYFLLAMCEGKLGNDPARLGYLKDGLRRFPKDPDYYNSIAWELAVSTTAALRNGREAVRLARRACELTSFRDPNCLDTLAAASAETGDFANAIKSQQQAIALFSTRDREHLSGAQKRLVLYQSKQPYREDPRVRE